MGLNFSHCDAHWSYSGFKAFRRRICLTLDIIESLNECMYDNDKYIQLEDDDIYPLINHSDCEGVLTVEEMKKVAPRLQEIIDEWKMNNPDYGYQYDIQHGQILVEGMVDAIRADEELNFR